MSGSDFEPSVPGSGEPVKPAVWSDGVAIIGMSARFPGAPDIQQFWKKLQAGESMLSTLSDVELRAAGVDEAALADPAYVRRGGKLEDAENFDAKFFGFSRREAEITDPQHRVFLEAAWEALEDSGYTGESDHIGVFAGVSINSYFFQLMSHPDVLQSAGGYQLMLSNDKDFMATRVAYKLNLRGPAVVVQTACSTSLAAVHLACQNILADECGMALAGGVCIPFPQGAGYPYIPGMILSPDGYCRPFDKDAKGTVPGRGAGVVVLKRYSRALKDGDSIYAVIRGSAWNNDGAQKIGYTAPGIDGQAAVIREAQRVAGVPASRIGYVETHGTATELGDPIEIAALSEVFAGGKPGSCVLGALKANLGHADVAAGVAGLIKATLAIRAGVIPPTPNFREPAPALGLDQGPFVVSSSAMTWPRAEQTSGPRGEEMSEPPEEARWAGVSSFGIGGTNVHVVLSGAPRQESTPGDRRARVFPISARTESALKRARERLETHLDANPAIDLAAVASTLQLGRRAFAHRFAVVASTVGELAAKLREPMKSDHSGQSLNSGILFLFPGQGQQFAGMAAGLYRADPAFRKVVDLGSGLIRDTFGIDLAGLIAATGPDDRANDKLTETRVAQPALFLVEYALATRWRSLGVEPAALLGHSLGELAAATVAGVFSFEDGLRLAAERGMLMGQTPKGAMLAVSLASEALAPYLGPGVWLAAENAPRMSVASGLPEAIGELERRLAKDRVAAIRLSSGHAFHTPLMADAAKAFREKVAAVSRKAPAIPWLSNVTGTWIEPNEAQSPQYWANQILSRVRFAKCIATLGESARLLLEVGPGDALIGMARQQMRKSVAVPSLGSVNRVKTDDVVMLEASARLWHAGVDLAWRNLHPFGKVRRVSLPAYPFEREKCYIGPADKADEPVPRKPASAAAQPLKRDDISSWFYVPSWQSTPPSALTSLPAADKVDHWLLLLDPSDLNPASLNPADLSPSGLGGTLAARLDRTGAAVISVSPSAEFTRTGRQFSINPQSRADYERLWREIAALGIHPTGLICFWTMRNAVESAFDSLVLLIQTASRARRRFSQIEIVTDGIEQVLDEKVDQVERAEVLGLMRVISVEFPGTKCRSIDIDPAAGTSAAIAEQILSEIRLQGNGLTIASRGATRWQKAWAPAPLPGNLSGPFKKGGQYLITGGIGGIGYVLARHLLRDYSACVVLTGRTELPPRGQWDLWLREHDAADPTAVRIRRIAELEQLEGRLQFIAADVTDRNAMSAVILRMRSHGRIDGVIHAAGLPGGGMIGGLDLSAAAAVLRPKVLGTRVLAGLLQGTDLDFLLLCSSISAVWPGPGQAAYAAANEFQNYFAGYCRTAYGLPAIAVGFDAWREVGMGADMSLPEGFEEIGQARNLTAMTPGEGVEVIERILGNWRGPRILTSTVGLEMLTRPLTPAVSETNIPAESSSEIDAIIEVWSDLLADKEIGPKDNFFDLGGHSLLGTMVLSRLRERLGVVLTLKSLFEAPTPETLAERIRFSLAQAAPTPVVAGVGEEREEFEI
jgi:acyl transferase domain-containing protein